MIHLPALPGSPDHRLTLEEIRAWMLADAQALAEGGVHGWIIENIGDAPFYPDRVPAHTVAFLTVLGHELRQRYPLPLGVNVLRNDGESALAVAAAIGAQFIRVNVYTGARLTDQGIIQAAPHRIARYRKLLGSEVGIFADVAVKHSASLATRDLADEVEDTILRAKADAVIVSGAGTGKKTDIDVLRRVKEAAGCHPVFVGSGADVSNVAALLMVADGVIAGTSLKRDAVTGNPVETARVREFLARARAI